MKHHAALVLFLLAAGTQTASAQNNLSPQLAHGRQILTQNCNICHLPQNPGSATYGPRLSKSSVNGDDALMKEVILNGLEIHPERFGYQRRDCLCKDTTGTPAPDDQGRRRSRMKFPQEKTP